MSTPAPAIAPSALQTHLTTSLDPSSPHPAHLQHLAAQVAHNLQYQHNWTYIEIHHTSPLSPDTPLPRPLISGLPPSRLYTHSDEQIALLKAGQTAVAEREWVLPSQLREEWSLRRFGEVFDLIGTVPQESSDDEASNPWRTTKRVLLATVDDDSTVVYYIVHDGIVKPRQN